MQQVGSQLTASVVMHESGASWHSTDVVARGDDWETYDLLYRPGTSDNSLLRAYTIFEAKLVRITPHIVLDAKRARGRQFKAYYLDEQALSFEGEFDRFFDVYSPDHYEIDTLSFISPEVMQAFLDLKEYDAELIHGHLLVFGPLMDGDELARFQAAGRELARQLNDNLSRYRDSYLPSRDAKRHITPFARVLLANPWQHAGRLIGGFLVIVAMVAYIAITDSSNGRFNALFYAVFVALLWLPSAVKTTLAIRHNRRVKKSFYSDLRVIQERGRY
jgi:hypothetical protein